MDLPDEPPPRRPLFFPVVIATVFLTIIGMSAGLVLGADAKQNARVTARTATTPSPDRPDQNRPTQDTTAQSRPAQSKPAQSRPAQTRPAQTRPAHKPQVVKPAGSPSPCRSETQAQGRRAGADGVLRVVLHVRTTLSTVWICADADDRLFYHGNRGDEDAEWVDGRTALFLPDAVVAGDGYRAGFTDAQGGDTVFDVTRQQLTIRHSGGGTEVQPVVAVVSD